MPRYLYYSTAIASHVCSCLLVLNACQYLTKEEQHEQKGHGINIANMHNAQCILNNVPCILATAYWKIHRLVLLTGTVLNFNAAMMQQTPLVITQLRRCADSIPLEWYQLHLTLNKLFSSFHFLKEIFKNMFNVKALLLKQPLSCPLHQHSSHLFIPLFTP